MIVVYDAIIISNRPPESEQIDAIILVTIFNNILITYTDYYFEIS